MNIMKKTPYKLNSYEKETILLTSEGDTEVSFETFNAPLKKRLAAFSKQYPELCRLVRSNDDGGVRYMVAKKNLVFSLRPPLKPESRQALSRAANIDYLKGA